MDETLSKRTIDGGWLDRHTVSKARKPFRCDYNHGKSNGGRCDHTVQIGEWYVNGERNIDRAGGFGGDRYCGECAGPEARAAISRATGEKVNG